MDARCISKGKEHKQYEFGNRVSITRTGTDVIVGALSFRNEFDGYVFHQTNKFMINFLRKKLKIAPDKFHIYMSEVGNTISNTIPIPIPIPIVLVEKIKDNALTGNILLAGFGVGYSWGGCVIKM